MKNIITIDDDFLSLNALYSLLDWGVYGLRIAHESRDGLEALEYLSKEGSSISIAFIDVSMPNMDGLQLLQRIKREYSHIVCFMLSNYSDFPFVREALTAGARDYILKYEMTAESVVEMLSKNGLCDLSSIQTKAAPKLLQILTDAKCAFEIGPGYLCVCDCDSAAPLLAAQRQSIEQTCRHVLLERKGALAAVEHNNNLVIFLPGSEMVKDDVRIDLASVCHILKRYCNVIYEISHMIYCADTREARSVYALYSGSDAKDIASHERSRTAEAVAMARINTYMAGYSDNVRNAIAYINSNYRGDLHLNAVADHCHVSYNHLSFLFKRDTGINMISYLNYVRIYQAARMLYFDKCSVTQAYTSVGYKNYKNFIQNFKSVTGLSPTEFRQSDKALAWLINMDLLNKVEGADPGLE
ncbi:MAG: response regulator [Clostridia bacterium]|nr:response regulator [Clostridia bacterium]